MDASHGVQNLGPDRVQHHGEQLIVQTGREMDDWVVRNYRKTTILFEGRRYYIARKEVLSPGRISYFLEQWPERSNEMPGKTIFYDLEYVQERDRTFLLEQRHAWQRYLLLPFLPLIGFLFSPTKQRIEDSYGISARTTTLFSIWAELVGFLSLGVLAYAFAFANLYFLGWSLSFFDVYFLATYVIGSILLLVDVAMRYSSMLKEDLSPLGLFEWVFRWRRR
jgi:hypothetical protein